MSSMTAETEGELEMEQEMAHEFHHEGEHEQEQEHEAFFNHLAAMGDRFGRPQSLRRVALAAARSALRANAKPYPAIEGEFEFEGELAGAGSLELEAGPVERGQAVAMMEHMGHAAAEAANEQEAAEHFLPLIGLAAKFVAPKLLGMAGKVGGRLLGKLGSQLARRAGPGLLRRVAPRVLGRTVPGLTRAVGNVTRTLYRSPSTRPLLHAMPRIARGTMGTLVRQVALGRRVTPQFAVRQLARQTARTLSNPRVLKEAYRRSLVLDRRFHRHSGRVLGRPVGPLVRAAAAAPGFAAVPHVFSAPAAAAGGCNCRCTCQPVGAQMAHLTVPTPVGPTSVRTAAPSAILAGVCPTCGR